MSFWYAVTEFPFYMFKKFAAGMLFFSWWTVAVLNFLGAIPFAYAIFKIKSLDCFEKRFVAFALTSLIILMAVASLDGIHLRHLINIQGLLAIAAVIGLIYLKSRTSLLKTRYIGVAAIILLLLPYRFPSLEMELNDNYIRLENNKMVYELIRQSTAPDAVIVSDASDAVWWYCDRRSIWIPVIYDDFRKLTEITRVDYVYLENTPEFVERLDNGELLDFLTRYAIVDGSDFGWGLYETVENSGMRP